MALQGPFIQQSDFKDKSRLHPKALFKVIKASIVAEDYEVLKASSEELNVVEFVTRHNGQGVVMVYADELAYKNRAIPVGSFFVDFQAFPELPGQSILELAYEAIPPTLKGDPSEYLLV